MAELKLKPFKGGEYPRDRCAVSRCQAESEVVDATRRIWPVEVPLCGDHFALRPDPPPSKNRGVALGTCPTNGKPEGKPWKVPQEPEVPERARSATSSPGNDPGNDPQNVPSDDHQTTNEVEQIDDFEPENDPQNVPGPVRNRRLFG